jgi:hypothetical protein
MLLWHVDPFLGNAQNMRTQQQVISRSVFYVARAMPIPRQRVAKYIPKVTLSTINEYPLLGNGAVNTVFSVGSCRGVIKSRKNENENYTRVEAGSNSSIVTLRVVGGDEKGSLKSETVKYGRESQGTKTEKDCAGKGQRHIQKIDPSSRQRGRPTKSRT